MEHGIPEETPTKTSKNQNNQSKPRFFYACFSETKLFVAAARLTGKHIF
jgi:hypothetical protein